MNAMQLYLTNLLSLNLAPTQKAFYKWELAQLKEVKITPIDEITSLAPYKQKLKKLMQFKDCYGNAVKICEQISQCRYIEGYILSIGVIQIKHAWNKIGNQYFDVTSERFFESNFNDPYFQILNLSQATLYKMMMKTGTYGDVELAYFKSRVLKEK